MLAHIRTSLAVWALTLAAMSALLGGDARADGPPGPRPARPEFQLQAEQLVAMGTFPLRPQATFYLILDQPFARGRALVQRARHNSVMLRVFDAEERLTHWQYAYDGMEEDIFHPRDGYVDGLPPLPAPEWGGEAVLDGSFALVGQGVHQVRLHGASTRSQVALSLSQPTEYGVSFQNGEMIPWEGMPLRMYVFVPPRAETLHVRARGRRGRMQVLGEDGETLFDSQGEGGDRASIPVRRTGEVWTFAFDDHSPLTVTAHGFPVIFCTTPEAARRIRASVEILDDGTVVAHKFQRRADRLIRWLLAPERAGDAEELIRPLPTAPELWLPEARRNRHLFGRYSVLEGIPHALRSQNVNPACHWGGAFAGYESPEGVAPEEHRWDRFVRVAGVACGSGGASGSQNLARAALLDQPFNPYRGRRELLYRAAAASLRDLMLLNDADLFPRGMGHWYPSMLFPLVHRMTPTFRLAAPHMPEEVRDVWAEGLRRLVDRSYTDHFVSCRNQSSHQLLANSDYAIGADDPVYERLARIWARRFAESAHPAGWFHEANGPCASYNGMTHWHMAVYVKQSGDMEHLEALRKSYRFFNHTVAPEPDGAAVLGGFNFNHRIGQGAFSEQYGGGKGIVDDLAPEVALYRREPEEPEVAQQEALESILTSIRRQRFAGEFGGGLTFARYKYWTDEPDLSGVWPAKEEEPYIRNIAEELIAAKRPAYYCAAYVGRPAGEFYIRRRAQFREPLASGVEEDGGPADIRTVTPFLGGGLSLFWTPDYGTALMGTNWSPFARHGLVAVTQEGKRFWEEYHAARWELDEEAGTLTIRGRVEDTPVAYVRTYTFGDEALEVELALTADETVRFRDFVENLPVAAGRNKQRGAEISPSEGEDGRVEAAAFAIRDEDGAGVDVELDEPRSARVWQRGMVGQWGRFQVNRIEIALPAQWEAGETHVLRYVLRPVPSR